MNMTSSGIDTAASIKMRSNQYQGGPVTSSDAGTLSYVLRTFSFLYISCARERARKNQREDEVVPYNPLEAMA